MAAIARLAVARGYGWMGWSVLNWNEPAIGFYRAAGARPITEWTAFRLDDEPLRRLAASADSGSRRSTSDRAGSVDSPSLLESS
jgi:hypothetical protein